MLKKITLIIAVVALSSTLFAQDSGSEGAAPLSKGGKQLNFGLGLNDSNFPVYFGVDWAVHDDVTIGFIAATNLDGFDYLTVLGRGDYHFNRIMGIPNNFDFYAGLNLGFRAYFDETHNNNNGNRTSGLALGIHVGGRWFWSESWGLNLEFGGGYYGSGGQIGLTRKL